MENIFESKCYELNIQAYFSFYRTPFFTGVAKPYKTRGPILPSVRLVDYFASVAVECIRILKNKVISI